MPSAGQGQMCTPCSQLSLKRADFTAPPFEPQERYNQVIRTGTVNELRSSKGQCGLCDLIWYSLERSDSATLGKAKDLDGWTLRWSHCSNDYEPTEDGVEDGVEDLYGSALVPSLSAEGSSGDYGIQLIDEKCTDAFLRGRVVETEVDFGMLRAWIKQCQQGHGDTCLTSGRQLERPCSQVPHVTVIDVEDLRLCTLPTNAPYVALSYVWGLSNLPVTLLSNRPAFERSQGLAVELPRTIQDAIDVCRTLQYRYLWVDSLCITQDDLPNKQLHIANMDSVYRNAILTLVAASGRSAQSGLFGPEWKHSRDQRILRLNDDLSLGVLPFFDRELMECTHAERAWTYQETCLSPRCLIFLNGFAYFVCPSAIWSEHTMAEVRGIEPTEGANTLGKTQSEWPLRRYQQHVMAFTSRRLTYQSDGLNAFSGIASAMARDMGVESMFFGMPASVFDWTILWSSILPLRRRPGFPSWAWVGWEGYVLMAQDTYSLYDQKWLLKGTWIDWYRVGERGVCVQLWDPSGGTDVVSPLVQLVLEPARDQPGRDATQSVENEEGDENQDEEGEESKDEKDDEEDGEQDKDDTACPTYGSSSPTDPFGRCPHKRVLDLLPERPLHTIPTVQITPLPDGLLYFLCSTIKCPTRPQEHKYSQGFHHLLDRYANACGFVDMGSSDAPPCSEQGLCKIAILSVASYGILGDGRSKLKTLGDAYIPDEDAELLQTLEDFRFLNVALLLETDTTAVLESESNTKRAFVHERAGVGLVHRDALKMMQSSLQWEEILLA